MKKTHLMSALALALVLAAANSTNIYATDAGLEAAQSAVERAAENVKNNPNSTYPGVDKYLEGLLEESKRSDLSEAERKALTEAMNDAAETANLLFGSSSKAQSQSNTASMPKSTSTSTRTVTETPVEPAAETAAEVKPEPVTPVAQVAQPEVQTAVATEQVQAKVELASQEIAVLDLDNATESEMAEGRNDDETDEAPMVPDGMELPKTGTDESKMNRAVFAVAGAAVMLVTALTTLALLVKKHLRK